MAQKLIFTNLVGEAIDALVADLGNPPVFTIADTNTFKDCLPVLQEQSNAVNTGKVIQIEEGDTNKNLHNLEKVWKALLDAGASRDCVVVNLGGGVVSDLGGFAASTFKRGMRVINVPTTLLGAVDASVGGKTGINFNGAKNMLGTFNEPEATIISTAFFVTLPQQQLLSGYAEMIKHALLESREELTKLLNYSVVYPIFDADRLLPLIESSVQVKANIVASDFKETGLRKSLNLGHTVGHAFESLAFERNSPIAHGFAVAQGLVVALIMSHLRLGFPSDVLHQVAQYVRTNYNAFDITCDDYPTLLNYMHLDKKNDFSGTLNFTLLSDVGQVHINQPVSDDEVKNALDIYRDMMGL